MEVNFFSVPESGHATHRGEAAEQRAESSCRGRNEMQNR